MRRQARGGFTLMELLVVIAMIMILAGAVTTAVANAQRRAKIARATAECREMTNAILAYENYDRERSLQNRVMQDVEAGRSTLGFILGEGGTTMSGEKVPVLYNASMKGGKIVDPWGNAYRVTIQPAAGLSNADQVDQTARDMYISLFLPNYTRLSPWERSQ